MNPLISVQIPVRNGGRNFRRCLDSLIAQDTGGAPWELVIVDDGSDVPVVETYSLEFPENVDVKVLRREGPGNRPEARNEAWRNAAAPLSLLSDGDILFSEDTLKRHLERHSRGGIDVLMGARVDAWRKNATPWQRWFDGRGMGDGPPGIFPGRYLVTGNLSMKTNLLRDTGGFDPAIDKYGGEDTEFGIRLQQMGISMYWDPAVKVYHLDDVTVRKYCSKMMEFGGSGLKYILRKHPAAAGMLGSDWIRPVFSTPARPSAVLMRLLCRLALWPPFYGMILRWMEIFGRPSFLFTYLSVGACLIGLKSGNFEDE